MVKYRITTRFADIDSYHSRPHSGYDFAMQKGEPLRAIVSGKVHFADYGNLNAGKTVFITDSQGHTFIYGHCSRFANLKDGQFVHKGDIVSYAGNTGRSFGSHLHFGVKENGHFIDGKNYISQIEHMNDKVSPFQQPFQHHATQLADKSYNFHDAINSQMNIYTDLLHNLKINLINIIGSIDYTSIIHHFQNLFNLFFG